MEFSPVIATGLASTVYYDRNMRALIDAVDKLIGYAGISEDSNAVIETGLMHLPSGETTHLITLEGCSRNGHAWRIALPPSNEMRASNTFSVRQLYDVSRLEGATVDPYGNVALSDGTQIHAVEFLPTRLHYQLTNLEKTIIRHVIRSLGKQERYRPYQNLGAEGPYQRYRPEEWLKHTGGVDYSVLPDLELPPLNVLEQQLAKLFPSLKRQTMTLALFKAGIPLPPRSRKRKRAA